jgi:hypothetical protein
VFCRVLPNISYFARLQAADLDYRLCGHCGRLQHPHRLDAPGKNYQHCSHYRTLKNKHYKSGRRGGAAFLNAMPHRNNRGQIQEWF